MNEQPIAVTIKIHKNNTFNSYKITLPDIIYKQVIDNLQVKLKVGRLEVDVNCELNYTENNIEIPCSLAEAFGLCEGKIVSLIIKDNKICLGPVIGIFASNGLVRKANAKAPSFRLIETMKANKESNAIVYYFSIKDVDFVCKRIRGTYFNDVNEQWERKYFPYPDILYDRGGELKSQKIISDNIRKELEIDKSFKKINDRYFFDKWDVHKQLMKYENMVKYLPPTVLYIRPDDLIEMFRKSPVLYVKDCLGNNGIGVARVVKFSENRYELSHFFKKTFKYNLSSFDELLEKIETIFESKKIIIQNAINLLQVNNRNIDMRATVQRNGKGELEIIAFPVRLGKEECPITSTRSGASVYRIDEFFKKFFNYSQGEVYELKKRISTFLFTSFRCIEDIYGNFGEIGIDFALDKQLRLWFIECNAKPGKDTLYLSCDSNIIKKAFLNPLEYAKYLWMTS